jgi:hypothetical protein
MNLSLITVCLPPHEQSYQKTNKIPPYVQLPTNYIKHTQNSCNLKIENTLFFLTFKQVKKKKIFKIVVKAFQNDKAAAT